MSYYPKSQIKTNLYTNGGEYLLSLTKEEYKGYYYETSNRTKYTGKTPQDGPNILLNPIVVILSTPNKIISSEGESPFPQFILSSPIVNATEDILISPVLSSREIPKPNPTTPTQQDQNLGVFQRYFCKKNNELKYLEIDKPTHDKLKSQQQDIAWDLYTPISTLWYIKGDKEQTFKANKGLISLVEKDQKWYGFTQWFKDRFLQYYLES
jgi:hypothetical protein